MSTKTSILIRRHILDLEPETVFFRKDLRKYGNKNAVDLAIYHFIKRGEIVRLLRGVYLRKQVSNWKPSTEQIAKIKAVMLGRLITEDSISMIKKIVDDEQIFDQTSEEINLVFNTTGRSLNFKYEGKTIHFKETSAKNIKLNDDRIGRAIVILWHLGEGLPLEDARWFLQKYLHRSERHYLRQNLPGLPEWLLEKLKSALPDYLPLGFKSYDSDQFTNEEETYNSKGTGPSLIHFDFH
ncbi:MAG: hypothetical protein K2X81_21595 [Candidatus Obscuribacterales bacterium]|nr:hypothetical protein [Candidatus Obscuribacterales bacterium]